MSGSTRYAFGWDDRYFFAMMAAKNFSEQRMSPYLVTRQDLKETLEYISGYSLYACEDELRQGYISVQGGHRVGVTGKVILDQGNIRSIKYISCVNVRLAHQILGCADAVMPFIRKKEKICHTLLISPPGLWQDDASSGHGAPDQQRE